MDLDAIAVFVKVVEVGSFTGAAKLLQMPKTTVSAKISSLEKRLGVTLIQRTTRSLRVTEAGQNYFRHCAQAIKEIEQGESALLAERDQPKGLLRVTAPIDLGRTVLPRIVGLYLQRYPETTVELIVTNRLVDLVTEGIDLAIRAGDLKDSTLVAKKFFDIHSGFWAAPSYLKKGGKLDHPRDFAQHQVLGRSNLRTQAQELTDGKSTFTVTPNARVTADDFETIKSLVLLGEGIAWLPRFLVAPELKAKKLVQVLPKWHLSREGVFSFVYPGQRYSSPKVRAFIEMASAVAKDLY